ncbi:MAG: alpha-1,2-fucosyltransferase [Neisseriales bacterium]|nr:MAG: alpha-1,2-fucosyltransferase [Neisseriales bacterium]
MTTLIINCIGGLGNQMTQYAFYRELEFLGYNVKFYTGGFKNYTLHNGYELDKVFGIAPNYATEYEVQKLHSLFNRIKRKIGCKNNVVIQKHYNFNPSYMNYSKDSFIDGYWQSQRYFADVIDVIRKDFSFPPLSERNKGVAIRIAECNSISIHVRRGDYIGHSLYDGICDIDYYNRALLEITRSIENPVFFVFSNDLLWCRENLQLHNVVYVDINNAESGYCDLQLMSLCKHNILANSSFSWWAGWLNTNPGKLVIVPRKFFNGNIYDESDLYPESWVKI